MFYKDNEREVENRCFKWCTMEHKGNLEKLLDLFCEDQFHSLKHIIYPLNLGDFHWVMIKIDLCSKFFESVDFMEGFKGHAKARLY